MECGGGRGGRTGGRAGEEGGGACVFSGNFLQVFFLLRRDLLHKQPLRRRPRYQNLVCHLVASAGSDKLHHLVAGNVPEWFVQRRSTQFEKVMLKIACSFRQNKGQRSECQSNLVTSLSISRSRSLTHIHTHYYDGYGAYDDGNKQQRIKEFGYSPLPSPFSSPG